MKRHVILCNGKKISYMRRSGGKIPLVLVHGLCGGAIHFDQAFSNVALADHTLVAIDLPGFGNSDKVEPITVDVMASAVKAVIAEQGFSEKPWLAAHSMSGSVAARVVSDVSGISLIEGNVLSEHLTFSDNIIAYDREAYRDTFVRLQKMALAALRLQTHSQDKLALQRYATTYAQCTANTVWDVAKDFNEEVRSGITRALFADWLGPLYCLYGSAGSYAETIEDIKGALPQATLQIISGSGHFPMIDNPDECYAVIAAQMKNGF